MSPANLRRRQLGELLEFKNGKSIKPGGVGAYPVYGANGVIGGSDEYREANAIVLGRVGAYCGAVAFEKGRFWASDNTIVVYPKDESHSVRYLSYLLRWLNLRHWAGGAAQPLLTQTALRGIEAPVAHPESQRKIASILSAYDDLIENNLRRIKILEEMAQALYREWFVEFRFPGRDVASGELPRGWGRVPLSEVAEVNEISIRPRDAPDEIIYVAIGDVSTGSIDARERMAFGEAPGRARRVVRHGDTIWSTVRPNRKSYALIVEPEPNLVVSTGFAVLSPKAVPFTYLHHAVTTEDFVGYLVNHAKGSAYPAVSQDDFRNAPVVVPEGGLLDDFHEMTGSMTLLATLLVKRNIVLRQSRDLLLPRLISGELDVSDLDIDAGNAA